MATDWNARLKPHQAFDRIDDSFARLWNADAQIARLDDTFRNAHVMTLDEFTESIKATGLQGFKRMLRRPVGHDQMHYRGDVRYLVGSILRGDVMKIDDDRVDRAFNDAVPAVEAAWVEVNEQRKPPVMTAERIAELTSRETP